MSTTDRTRLGMEAEAEPTPPLPLLVDGTSTYRPVIRHRNPTVRGAIVHAIAEDPLAALPVVLVLVVLALAVFAALVMVVVEWVA